MVFDIKKLERKKVFDISRVAGYPQDLPLVKPITVNVARVTYHKESAV